MFEINLRKTIIRALGRIDDYSLCSKKAQFLYPFIGEARTFNRPFKDKKYTIATEAMFLINWAVFGDVTTFMTSLPVLLDVKNKKVVKYNDRKSIRKIAKKYFQWIEGLEKGEKMSLCDMFFLVSADIIWNGSEKLLEEKTKLFFEEYFKMEAY